MQSNKIKVVLSTFGPLHLIKSAEFLTPLVDITVIQGWIPAWWNRWLLPIISRIIGYDLGRTIKKRTPLCLEKRNIGLAFPDFYNNFIRFFIKDAERCDKYQGKSLNIYGRISRKHLHNADIFHVRSGSGRGGAIEYAKKNGMKILVDHSIAHPIFMEKQLKSEYEKHKLSFKLGSNTQFWHEVINDCQEADIILVNSFFVKDTFIEAGFNEEKIKIAYLGVRKDFFSLKTDYSTKDKLKILFTGGFGIRKGAEFILKAMQQLDKLGIDYEFFIIGNYSEATGLLKKYPIKGLRLMGFIPQDDLKFYLSTCDIYLFPSLCEGCASSGMEALASGLPVIATEESGLPITDEKTGILVPSKNVEAIVEKILYLRENYNIRKKIGVEAAKMIKKDYTWEKYAENVLQIYSELKD